MTLLLLPSPPYLAWLQEHPEHLPRFASAVLRSQPVMTLSHEWTADDEFALNQAIWGDTLASDFAPRFTAFRRWLLCDVSRMRRAHHVFLMWQRQQHRLHLLAPVWEWLRQLGEEETLGFWEQLLYFPTVHPELQSWQDTIWPDLARQPHHTVSTLQRFVIEHVSDVPCDRVMRLYHQTRQQAAGFQVLLLASPSRC